MKTVLSIFLVLAVTLTGCDEYSGSGIRDGVTSESERDYSGEGRDILEKHIGDTPEVQEKNDITTEYFPAGEKYVKVVNTYDLVSAESDLAQYGTCDYFPLGDVFFHSEVASGIAGHSSLPLKQRKMSMNVATLDTGEASCSYLPVLSGYTRAKNALLQKVNNTKIPAKVVYLEKRIYEYNQVDFELKTTLATSGLSEIKGSFDFSTTSTTEKTRILVKLEQVGVTLSCDYTTLEETVDFSQMSRDDIDYIRSKAEDDPLVYLSEIILGRKAILAIESDHTSTEVSSALSAAMTSVEFSGSASVTAAQKQVLDSLKISVFIYGGNSQAAVEIHGADSLIAFIRYMESPLDVNEMVPIAYRFRTLKSGALVKTAFCTEYTVTELRPAYSISSTSGHYGDWEQTVVIEGVINTVEPAYQVIDQMRGEMRITSNKGTKYVDATFVVVNEKQLKFRAEKKASMWALHTGSTSFSATLTLYRNNIVFDNPIVYASEWWDSPGGKSQTVKQW